MPDAAHISDLEDIDSTHLPKINPRPEWLKPIPEEDRPKTPEPDWSVPPNDLPEPENNWAKMHSSSPIKILRKTSYFGRLMEECHWLLTDQVDLVNPEGHRFMPDVNKPLPLGGPPGQ
ncbi:hypothetical protein Tco_0202405, partial [Tanacetum coccineum]